MGQKIENIEITIDGKIQKFKAKQLSPIPSMLVQVKLQKDLAPLLFSFFQESGDEANLPLVFQQALQNITADTVKVLFHELLFASEIYHVNEKLVPLDENLFNFIFDGELLASWELLIKVLLLNYKSFILALPAKIQAVAEQGMKNPD